jgi:hypothetical protein
MTESYADHPRSLAEIKSEREHDAALWTPRDCLIEMLRKIDSGMKVGSMIICYSREDEEPGKRRACFTQATPDGLINLGLMSAAAVNLLKD